MTRSITTEFARYLRKGAFHPEFDDIPLFVERAVEWSDEEFLESAALLLYLVQGTEARDATLLQWATSFETGDELWQFSGLPVGDLALGRGPRPELSRLRQAVALLERLAAVAEPRARPAVLSMLAWLNWVVGDSVEASAHLDAVAAIDPGYRMAVVVRGHLVDGVLPDWAFEVVE